MYRQESDECVPPHIVMRHENAFWERLFESAGLSYYNHPSWYYMRSGEVMIDEIVTEQERQGLFHDSDAAEIQRAIDSAYEHDNWDDHAAASALYETYDEVYEDDAVEAAIAEQAIADAAAHDADADADDAAAAYYITYVADYDAGDAAAAFAEIAAAQDGGDVYAHADAHEAVDPAAAAAAAAEAEAEAAELRVIRAEVHHRAEAMVAYFDALYDENARMAAVPFGSRGGARDGLLRTCRNGH